MAESTPTIADAVQIKAILMQYSDEGIKNPLLPIDPDTDGDGFVDAYGLDTFGKVIRVSHVPLKDTVFLSDGNDIGPNGVGT